jgi:predicted metal-dependent HD superfamily phosphohydrolase
MEETMPRTIERRLPPEGLAGRWAALLDACEVEAAAAAPVWSALLLAYGHPSRAHHTLAHLEHLFAELDAVPLLDPAVEWAAWFHDAVYRAWRRDNELCSAALARRTLEALGLERLGPRVVELVLATRLHRAEAGDTAALLFLDADLAVLGAAPDCYQEYARAVRREHPWAPGFLYDRGRMAFLRGVLERPTVFATPHFQRRYELQARANLRAELASLERR